MEENLFSLGWTGWLTRKGLQNAAQFPWQFPSQALPCRCLYSSHSTTTKRYQILPQNNATNHHPLLKFRVIKNRSSTHLSWPAWLHIYTLKLETVTPQLHTYLHSYVYTSAAATRSRPRSPASYLHTIAWPYFRAQTSWHSFRHLYHRNFLRRRWDVILHSFLVPDNLVHSIPPSAHRRPSLVWATAQDSASLMAQAWMWIGGPCNWGND
jgi:hypothetical protein